MARKKLFGFLFLTALAFTLYTFLQHVDFQGYEDETYNRIRENLATGQFKASRCGYGQIVLETPFVFLGELLNSLLNGKKNEYVKLIALFYNPFITALIVGISFLIFHLFVKIRQALLLAVIFAFATMLFPYALIGMEPTSLLCVALSIFFLFRFGKSNQRLDLLLSGLAFFSLFFGKSYYFFTGPAFALYLLLDSLERGKPWFKETASRLMIFFAPLALIFPLYLLGNNASYGGYWKSPYVLQNELFGGENFIFGLYGLLFSFGKSFFIYSPILLLSIWLFRPFYRKFRKEAIFTAAYTIILLLFVSRVHWWSDETWGPRYLVSLCLLLSFPLIMIFRPMEATKKYYRILIIGFVSLSVAFQLLGVVARYGVFPRTLSDLYTQTGHNTLASSEYQYVPAFAPYLINAALIRNQIIGQNQPLRFRLIYTPPMEQMAQGAPLIKDIEYAPPKETSIFDFWWRKYKKKPEVYFSILAVFVLIFAGLYHFGRRFFRS